MTKKMKRKKLTKKRKGGKNNNGKKNNCKTKCKAKFVKILKKDKRIKALNNLSSFFGKKKNLNAELNEILDSDEIQNDPVFKGCVSDCKKNK